MTTRKTVFVNNEFYHVYNRGVDKRNIVMDENDSDRFMKSVLLFNSKKPIGSIFERMLIKNKNKLNQFGGEFGGETAKLVNIVAYCLNPNHFHFILEQVTEGGISEFMKRLGGGYTWYFNNKHKRSGSLFQGVFKSVHIDDNQYLLNLSVYVNLNNRVHKFGGETAKLVRSSWNEYLMESNQNFPGICSKDIILSQFKKNNEYKNFAEEELKEIIRRKDDEEISKFILE